MRMPKSRWKGIHRGRILCMCLYGWGQLTACWKEDYWTDIKDTVSPPVGTNEGVISSEEKAEKDLNQLLL